jgi:hypothetical protein
MFSSSAILKEKAALCTSVTSQRKQEPRQTLLRSGLNAEVLLFFGMWVRPHNALCG